MSIEKCIWRLSKEQADWFNLDCCYLAEGKLADLVIMNPNELHQVTDEVFQEPIVEFDHYIRLVNRNQGLIEKVLVGGKVIFENDEFVQGYGENQTFGRFIPRKKRHKKDRSPHREDLPLT